MSEVKRYDMSGYGDGMIERPDGAFVHIDDHQSELAALREELAKFDEGMRALACSLGAGGYNAEKLAADQLIGKVQWGIENLLSEFEKGQQNWVDGMQRLTAAEQRNAAFQEAALDVISNLGEFCCGLQSQSDVDYITEQLDKLAALINPTESGVSE